MGDIFRSILNVGLMETEPLSSSVTTPASPKSPYFDLEIDSVNKERCKWSEKYLAADVEQGLCDLPLF